jgi:hypothetical protein
MAYVRVVICYCGLLMLAGCGNSEPSLGKLVPVQGKITLSDGTPLPGGYMTLFPIESDSKAPPNTPAEHLSPPISGGEIGPDGSYTLSTKEQPGAPLGKYRVVLARGADTKAWSRVSGQYFDRRRTTLEIEVVEDKPEGGYDLKLVPRRGRGPDAKRGKRPD